MQLSSNFLPVEAPCSDLRLSALTSVIFKRSMITCNKLHQSRGSWLQLWHQGILPLQMWEVHFPLVQFKLVHTFSAQMHRKGFLCGFLWQFSLSASDFLHLLSGTLRLWNKKFIGLEDLGWRHDIRGSCSPFIKWTFQYRYKTHKKSHKVSVSKKLRKSKFSIHFKFSLFEFQQYFFCKFRSSQLCIMHSLTYLWVLKWILSPLLWNIYIHMGGCRHPIQKDNDQYTKKLMLMCFIFAYNCHDFSPRGRKLHDYITFSRILD